MTAACMLTTLRISLLDLDDGLQFDITFHKLPCAWTSLDAMDISGEMHLDVVSSLQICFACCHDLTASGSLHKKWITCISMCHAARSTNKAFCILSNIFPTCCLYAICRIMMCTRSDYKLTELLLMRAPSIPLGLRTLI